MILEIDWGNTRFKWRLLEDSGRLASSGAVGADERDRQARALSALAAPKMVRIASVRPRDDERWLSRWVGTHWHLTPFFARPRADCAGLRCGYREPERLGVDRWLALLAAWQAEPRAAVVVQAGTALTVDLLDNGGQHLGGYIAPGWRLMRQALFGGTARVVGTEAPPRWRGEPGRDTAEAVEAALSAMSAGLIGRALSRLEELSPRLILAGGDAAVLLEAYPDACLWPDIVFDGLSLAGGQEAGPVRVDQ